MTPSEKADRAREMLDSAIFKAVFTDMRERLVLNLEATPVTAVDEQHEIALMLMLIKKIKEQLQRYVDEKSVLTHKEQDASFMRRMKQSVLSRG